MREAILAMLLEIEPDSDFENCKDFFEEELLDSFEIITAVNMLEQYFSIQIQAEDISAENFMNLAAIERLVDSYIGKE